MGLKLTNNLPPQRPLRWEDDFSVNALDTEPFHNGIPIRERPEADLKNLETTFLPKPIERQKFIEALQRDGYDIPPPTDREGYIPGSDFRYWISGYRDYLISRKLLADFDCNPKRMMEMGAATGRVLRHYACQSDTDEIWATDINHRHIKWLASYMPRNVMPLAVPALPNLPIPDNHLDAILAYSVFTHIDTFETAHLAELRRVLRPGGVAILTVHTESTWEAAGDKDDPSVQGFRTRLEKIIPDFEKSITEPLAEGRSQYRYTEVGPYRGQVWHSTSYLETVWSRFFNILKIEPRGHNLQTIVVLQKPT